MLAGHHQDDFFLNLFCMSNEKKHLLFTVYNGLYNPIIFRDYNKRTIIRIPINQPYLANG